VKYYIVWEVRHDIKTIIFHNIVSEVDLAKTLNTVSKNAIGDVRYQEVEDPNNAKLAVEDLEHSDAERMFR
jgi:hypothetical protein